MEVKTINGYTIKDETARNQLLQHEADLNNIKSNLKFHSIANSSATYIVEFPNGKNMIVDTGMTNQWTDIKNAIDNLGITKFDYMIITHFHNDHIGNIQNICNTYDLSECTCWVQMKPDFVNHSEDIDEDEEDYDNVITLLEGYGLQPTVPVNDSYYTIDDNTKLHFVNTDTTIAEDYYDYITEYREEKVNFNLFSLVTEIIHCGHNIIATGDIEYGAEKGITPFVHKANLITTPHHGVNIDAYYGFYDSVNPEYSISSYVTENDSWVDYYYKSFMYLQEKGCRMITSAWTNPVNGLFTFISDYKDFYTTVIGEKKYVKSHSRAKLLISIHDLINPTQIKRSDLTINDVFNNMNNGDEVFIYWWESYNTAFPTLYSELQTLFPQFTSSWSLRLKKGDSHYKRIEVCKNNRLTLSCENYLSEITWPSSGRGGNGNIGEITGINNLITALKALPIGHYTLAYKDDEGTVLSTGGFYNLSVDITSNNGTNITASIIGILRNTENTGATIARVVGGYINTGSTPNHVWHQINN